MASRETRRDAAVLVFGPERDVPLSLSGLRDIKANDLAFKCDPVLSRWTPDAEGVQVRVAGYPQPDVIADGRIVLPTFLINTATPSDRDRYHLRVCLIVTTKVHNYFMPHPDVMLTVPLVRHRGERPLYGPAIEALTISDLRDGGRPPPTEDGKKAKRRRGKLAEIISIWPADAPATFAIQVCAGDPDPSAAWSHPSVMSTLVFKHARLANPTNERKKARKARAQQGADEVIEALLDDVASKKTPVGQ
jgi:hypothetical protein